MLNSFPESKSACFTLFPVMVWFIVLIFTLNFRVFRKGSSARPTFGICFPSNLTVAWGYLFYQRDKTKPVLFWVDNSFKCPHSFNIFMVTLCVHCLRWFGECKTSLFRNFSDLGIKYLWSHDILANNYSHIDFFHNEEQILQKAFHSLPQSSL